VKKDNNEFYKIKGNQHYIKENYQQSLINYKKYLKKNSQDFEVLFNVGRIYSLIKKYEIGLNYYEKCLSLLPKNKNILINISSIYIKIKDYDKAIESINKIDQNEKNDAIIYYNLALCYEKKLNFEDAINYYKISLNLNKSFVDALSNCGNCFSNIGQYKEAIKMYEEALLLVKEKDSLEILLNLASTYADLEDYNKAVEIYDKILSINSKHALALNNKANTLTSLKKFKKAIESYDAALKISPNNNSFKLNRGYSYLCAGNYLEGFKDYESRSLPSDKSLQLLTKKFPLLDLSKVKDDDKIFIWSEQGVGDQMLYSKYLFDLEKQYNVYLKIDPRLKAIIKREIPSIQFVEDIDEKYLANYDFQISLASLPGLFVKNEKDLISRKSYIFHSNNEIKSKILNEIDFPKNKIICGLSWNTSVKNIRHKQSIKLLDIFENLPHKNFYFINLQYGDVCEEISEIRKRGFDILDYKDIDNFKDIDGLISLIDICDCIVTVSNSTAHFSGSIGKKTYLLLPYDFYWYWRSDEKEKNLWYDDVKVIKKKNIKKNWKNVLNQLK